MRLWIHRTDLNERAIVRGILAGEHVLANRGVTLPECLAAISAAARNERPNAVHWNAFADAEHAALDAAFGSADRPGNAVLGLILSQGDECPDLTRRKERRKARRPKQ